MIIVIIGESISSAIVAALMHPGYNRPNSPPINHEELVAPKAEEFKRECEFDDRAEREYDRAINREQAKSHEVRLKKWSHQKPRAYRSQRRR